MRSFLRLSQLSRALERNVKTYTAMPREKAKAAHPVGKLSILNIECASGSHGRNLDQEK
jgi:hypothetical protein